MKAQSGETVLFTEREIAGRVADVAHAIVTARPHPQFAVPILAGGFVFAADLMRALSRAGLDLPAEFLWLRSYGRELTPGKVEVLRGPGESVRGRRILLIDGVCDSGATLAKAESLLQQAGAAAIVSAVAVTKDHADPVARPDHSMFSAGRGFLFGYGMDRMNAGRGRPDIRIIGKNDQNSVSSRSM